MIYAAILYGAASRASCLGLQTVSALLAYTATVIMIQGY